MHHWLSEDPVMVKGHGKKWQGKDMMELSSGERNKMDTEYHVQYMEMGTNWNTQNAKYQCRVPKFRHYTQTSHNQKSK